MNVTSLLFIFNVTAPTEIYTLSLHDALPICGRGCRGRAGAAVRGRPPAAGLPRPLRTGRARRPPRPGGRRRSRSEEHTSELQSRLHLVCRLLLEKKKNKKCLSDTHYTTMITI